MLRARLEPKRQVLKERKHFRLRKVLTGAAPVVRLRVPRDARGVREQVMDGYRMAVAGEIRQMLDDFVLDPKHVHLLEFQDEPCGELLRDRAYGEDRLSLHRNPVLEIGEAVGANRRLSLILDAQREAGPVTVLHTSRDSRVDLSDKAVRE